MHPTSRSHSAVGYNATDEVREMCDSDLTPLHEIARTEIEARVVSLLSGVPTPERAAELGLLDLAVPREYGGFAVRRDLQWLSWRNVFDRNHLIGYTLGAHYQVCRCIRAWGTLAQQRAHL